MEGSSLVCTDVDAQWMKGKRAKLREYEPVCMLADTNFKLADIFGVCFRREEAEANIH